MKMRSLAIGLSLLTAGTVIGVTTQQFASADISTGDRPVLVPIEPCRLVDTRPGSTVGPRSSRIGVADTLTVDAQEPGTRCSGAIPTDALSLALNVTAIRATELTFLTIWAGGARPTASSLNPAPGEPPTPNAVTVDLSIDQEFRIYNDVGSLDLVVDVTGYYENHNHDDRYYTEAEIDAEIGALKYIPLETGFDSSAANLRLDFSVIVPSDYTPGAVPRVVATLIPGLDASCEVRLARNFVWATRPGEDDNLPGGFGSNLIDVQSPADLVFDFNSGSSLQTLLLEFTLDVGDLIQPGDSLSFGFFNLGTTTCSTGRVLAANFYYE